jgi:DNA-directed RNA polymerase specialized sigma24 family protein
MFNEALRILERDTRLGETTMRAFQHFALEGMDVRAVADLCGISTSQVYVAKHRVMERVRETMDRLRKDSDDPA